MSLEGNNSDKIKNDNEYLPYKVLLFQNDSK